MLVPLTQALLTQSLIAGLADVPRGRVFAGDMTSDEWERVIVAADELASAPVFFDNDLPKQ